MHNSLLNGWRQFIKIEKNFGCISRGLAYFFVHIGQRLEICIKIGSESLSAWLEPIPVAYAYIPETVFSVPKATWVTRYLIVFLSVGMARVSTALRFLSDLVAAFLSVFLFFSE